jgi:diguanylate cyclase (GGDEF)-like protein
MATRIALSNTQKSAKFLGVFIIFSALLFTPLFASASIDNVRFERFFVEQGLSQQTITAIYQDSRGFMWFGTQEGLNLYDGRRFYAYMQSFDDPNAIASSWVTSITEDAAGNIWIGTRGGVSRYSPDTSTFTNFLGTGAPGDINDEVVRQVLRDKRGNIWVSTRMGINKYLPSQQAFKSYAVKNESNKEVDIFNLAEDSAGNIWLGSDTNGIYRFDPNNETFIHIARDVESSGGAKLNGIRGFLIDSEQRLLIGSFTSGVYYLDLKLPSSHQRNAQVVRWPSMQDIAVRDIFEDEDGVIWLASTNGLYFEKENGESGWLKHQSDDPFTLSDNDVGVIYKDLSDVMWVGSFKGLNKWNTATTQFDHYRVTANPSRTLSGNNITAITQLDENRVLIANTRGVDVIDLASGETSQLILPEPDKESASPYKVMSLATVDDEIWLGTRNRGVLVYNQVDNSFYRYQAAQDGEDPSEHLQALGITAIYPADKNTVWVATYGGGLSKVDRKTRTVQTYRYEEGNETSLSSDRVMSITPSKDGRLWLGTWDAGISIFNPDTELSYRITVNRDDKTGLSEDLIWTIFEDRDSNIWVGTQGGGMHLLRHADLDNANIKFTRLTKADGMPSNVVFGILQDSSGAIWSSSNRGLTKIDPQSLALTNFNYALGLQSDEFNSGSSANMDDGKMLFGGPNGVSAFYPDQVTLNAIEPKTVITGFQRLDKSSRLFEAQNANEEKIVVNYSDYLIGFEFASLHFTAPEKNQYRYRLRGLDDTWIDVVDSPRAIYTNLPAGNYIFEVISANSDGIWNTVPAAVSIKVKPAPWASIYAYFAYTLIAFLSCFLIYRWYHNKLQAETKFRQSLEIKVQQRTAELSEVNKKLLEASVTDQLTGLFNRRYLSDIIDRKSKRVYKQFIKAHARHEVSCTEGPRLLFLMFDLDGFKPINDSFGHDAGDRMIQEVAKLLKNVCRISDVVIRWGGDEFLVIGEVDSIDEATQLVEKIRSKIERKGFDIGLPQRVHLSSSLGFALYPFSHHCPDSLSWKQSHTLADIALYKSKEAGKNAWTGLLQSERNTPFSVMNTLVPNIEKAIESGDVRVVRSSD